MKRTHIIRALAIVAPFMAFYAICGCFARVDVTSEIGRDYSAPSREELMEMTEGKIFELLGEPYSIDEPDSTGENKILTYYYQKYRTRKGTVFGAKVVDRESLLSKTLVITISKGVVTDVSYEESAAAK